MKAIAHSLIVVAGLVLSLGVTSTSAAGPPNPTASDASRNTAGGTDALITVTAGEDNTAFGHEALTTNQGDRNTAVGAGALSSNTTGMQNTACGYQALNANTLGYDNTASGQQALYQNTTGFENTATGAFALWSNGAGRSNTATGVSALGSNDIGNNNTAVGVEALVFNRTGGGNTAVGVSALTANTDATNNTAVGFKALKKSTGTRNIGIGMQAGVMLTAGDNNIYIGHVGTIEESDTIRVGTTQTSTFMAGINSASVSGALVQVDGDGRLGVTLSSARYKREIEAMGARSAGMLNLRPVTFVYRDDVPGAMHYGLIAEEVAAVYPELVTRTATGEAETVRYQELIPMLLNELQRQGQEFQHALQSQQQILEQQQKELAHLRSLVGRGKKTALPR